MGDYGTGTLPIAVSFCQLFPVLPVAFSQEQPYIISAEQVDIQLI
jgi:hypothetical protein